MTTFLHIYVCMYVTSKILHSIRTCDWIWGNDTLIVLRNMCQFKILTQL